MIWFHDFNTAFTQPNVNKTGVLCWENWHSLLGKMTFLVGKGAFSYTKKA